MKKTGLIFCLLPLTLSLFGWGGGHTDHAQLVLQYLPREISSRWSPADQKTFRNRWAHSPDSSARIGEEILRMIGPDSVRVLNECGIQTYYKFHLESGRAAAFLLLVRAFREKNDPAALFFSGVLLHSLADTSAFNHGPLIHFLTYTRYGHVRYPKLKLDLSNMRGNSVFKEKTVQGDKRAVHTEVAALYPVGLGSPADKQLHRRKELLGQVQQPPVCYSCYRLAHRHAENIFPLSCIEGETLRPSDSSLPQSGFQYGEEC